MNDQYLYISQVGFAYFANTFFSNALLKAVQEFTDSGIIQYLFEKNHNTKQTFPPEENSPNVLNFYDLSFGFYIWLGACCVSVSVFFVEFLMYYQTSSYGSNTDLISLLKKESIHSLKLRKLEFERHLSHFAQLFNVQLHSKKKNQGKNSNFEVERLTIVSKFTYENLVRFYSSPDVSSMQQCKNLIQELLFLIKYTRKSKEIQNEAEKLLCCILMLLRTFPKQSQNHHKRLLTFDFVGLE